jgi:purine catabolism regulator
MIQKFILQFGGDEVEKVKVTIQDILHRPLFKEAILVAGENGKDREIIWTHILEMEAFESFINGGELILTTGSNLAFDSSKGIPKLEKLIELNAAGLCIELGTHIKAIEPEIIDVANKHNFPLLVFPNFVKFVDVTQDLHTILVNTHHEQLKHLHDLSNEFNELSLKPNGILKILKKLYEFSGMDVLLLTDDKQLFYYPLRKKEEVEDMIPSTDTEREIEPFQEVELRGKYYTVFPIKGLGHSWGELYIQTNHHALEEFTLSVIDRSTLAIAQIMLRNKTIEERKQNKEENFVQKLLHGKAYDPTAALEFLPAPAENLYYRLLVIENRSYDRNIQHEDWEEIKLQQSAIIRSIFKKFNFFPAISVTKGNIIVIASYYRSSFKGSDRETFYAITEAIKRSNQEHIFQGNHALFGISSLQSDYEMSATCYKEANTVLEIHKLDILEGLFYEDIGMYRLLIQLPKDELEAYVSHYLGPLCDEGKQDLLQTLAVYLETMGSKKETSERLAIVRQTLYHRLDKIEELIGDDYLNPINRQAIELAIGAYRLLYKNKN